MRINAKEPNIAIIGAARLKRGLLRTGQWLLDELAPQTCVFCEQKSSLRDLPLCDACCRRLNRNDEACPSCALPHCRNTLCPACQRRTRPGIIITAPYIYDASIAYLMSRWKYQGERRLCRVAAHLMLNNSKISADCDVLLPIPLHWRRQLTRGFNQSEELLGEILRLQSRLPASADAYTVPCKPLIFTRRRATSAQATMSRRQRQKNLNDAFCIRGDVSDLRITLIDDVCTTGATAQAAAETLLKAGAREVRLWCLARTPTP